MSAFVIWIYRRFKRLNGWLLRWSFYNSKIVLIRGNDCRYAQAEVVTRKWPQVFIVDSPSA